MTGGLLAATAEEQAGDRQEAHGGGFRNGDGAHGQVEVVDGRGEGVVASRRAGAALVEGATRGIKRAEADGGSATVDRALTRAGPDGRVLLGDQQVGPGGQNDRGRQAFQAGVVQGRVVASGQRAGAEVEAAALAASPLP